MLKSKQTSLYAIKRSLLRSTPEVQKLQAGILQISNYWPPSQKGSHLRKLNLNKSTSTVYNSEGTAALEKPTRYVKDNKTEWDFIYHPITQKPTSSASIIMNEEA